MHAQEVATSCAARTRKPAQEVKVLGFCSLPARTFETQEVENLAARSY